MRSHAWPAAEAIETARLTLEPLTVEHAEELAAVLSDARLHRFTGGIPATPEQLRLRYTRLVAGQSADGSQGWLNWIVRRREGGVAIGTVQATLRRDDSRTTAAIAWVIGSAHQGHGFAKEAATAMAAWLSERGADALVAYIHPEHRASIAVARALGLEPTEAVVEGEVRWIRAI